MNLLYFVPFLQEMQGHSSSLVDRVMKRTLMNSRPCTTRIPCLSENSSNTWLLIYLNFLTLRKQEKSMEKGWMSWLGSLILKIVLMENTCVPLQSVSLVLESYNSHCTP